MNSAEVMDNLTDEFERLQKYMLLAKKENANETYEEMHGRYKFLKAKLNSLGVNLSDIDAIKG